MYVNFIILYCALQHNYSDICGCKPIHVLEVFINLK